ncbi:IS200/IS605 family transposase [Poseidonibacter ostreae]|uniref:IS200/IS605 family transposase n=1 Tax=Poseidonibacter ostreae TaxID=2654171 RepID=A0A6L4WXU0_9BACT|nr:IS200/IS605 family transposase [Poseidonibacter ostreae]KAB7891270.1 IS200/IS605 family transposase [Poseidonibacter ostreae]
MKERDFKIQSSRYVKYRLEAFFLITTKNENVILEKEHHAIITEILEDIVKRNDCDIVNLKIEDTSIGFILNFLTRTTLSKIINSFKAVSSRKLRANFSCFKDGSVWNRKYLVLSIGDIDTEHINKFKEDCK